MLNRLKKKIAKNRAKILPAALAAAIALSLPQSAAWAIPGAGLRFDNDHINHILTGNISTTLPNDPGIGLCVLGVDTSAELTGNIDTLEQESFGAVVQDDGTIKLHGGNITTHGLNAYGLYTRMSGSITLRDGSITTHGVNGYGASTSMGGNITIRNSSITTHGPDAYGAFTLLGGTIELDNVAIESSSSALVTFGGTITASVDGKNITAPILIMNLGLGGIINLTANNGSRLYGKTISNLGGETTLNLNSGSTWTMPDSSYLTNLALNNGAVIFTPPTTDSISLTIDNTLSGNGVFYLNNNFTTGEVDQLIIAGDNSGNHQLYFRNQGGAPGNPHRTFKVVELDPAKSNAASFSGGFDAGVFRYNLAKGSALGEPYTSAGTISAEDFYLYNTLTASAPVRSAGVSATSINVVWYSEMNEIKKRLGELRIGKQSGDDFWVRSYANKLKVSPFGGEPFEQTMRGIELGRDNPQDFNGGRKFTGILVGAGKADNTFADGNDTIKSFYLGAYSSWLRDDGSYFDLIGKYNWLRHRFDTNILGGGTDSASFRNHGLGLSAEIGKRIERKDGVFIEPEAELSAFWATKNTYKTSNGINIENPTAKSLQLRLGGTIGRKTADKDGAIRQVYGKASWVHEFKGDIQTVADNAPFESSIKGDQLVAGLGFVEDIGQRQFYLDVEKSWGNRIDKTWAVNAGLRWKF